MKLASAVPPSDCHWHYAFKVEFKVEFTWTVKEVKEKKKKD